MPDENPARPAEIPVEPMLAPIAAPLAAPIEQAITGLCAPRTGGPDDLTRLHGVDADIAGKLHALGLYHFDQIARLSPGQKRWLFRQLAGEGRFPGDWWRWQQQASAIIAAG